MATGIVASLARPGGNLTGFSIMANELMPKRLELLSELVPRAKVIALLANPNNSNAWKEWIPEVEKVARVRGVQLPILHARDPAEIDAAFAGRAALHADALFVSADQLLNSLRKQIVALAARYAIPAVHEWRESVEDGGLISYAPSFAGVWRQLGTYVGRILSGAKPADLPIQQLSRFELVINLKTAKVLGLTIPELLLTRADEVIE